LAGGGGGELERGASSLASAVKGGRRGDERFLGIDFACHAGLGLPTLPIGSCHAGASVGALAVFLGSNGRWHVFGLAGGAPIWAPSPKSARGRVLGDVLGASVEML
jgi:hypothetical protein